MVDAATVNGVSRDHTKVVNGLRDCAAKKMICARSVEILEPALERACESVCPITAVGHTAGNHTFQVNGERNCALVLARTRVRSVEADNLLCIGIDRKSTRLNSSHLGI